MLRKSRCALSAAAGFWAVLLAFTAASWATDTQLAWQGIGAVTAATPQCSGIIGVGDHYTTVFRPKIKATDSNTFMSLLYLRAALTLQNKSESTVPQMNGSGNYTATGIDSRALAYSYSSTYAFTVTPSPVTATTSLVTIDGTITNIFNVTGCDVTFHAEFVPYF